jgi:hypothetical protein
MGKKLGITAIVVWEKGNVTARIVIKAAMMQYADRRWPQPTLDRLAETKSMSFVRTGSGVRSGAVTGGLSLLLPKFANIHTSSASGRWRCSRTILARDY